MTRNLPIAHHDCGVSLYAPTAKVAAYRLVWTDPLSGAKPKRK